MSRRKRRTLLERAMENKQFREERDKVLRSLDTKLMNVFFARWGHALPRTWAVDKPNPQLASMHMARLDVLAMTREEKLVSAKWLIANTYSLPAHIKLEGGSLIGPRYETKEEGS